MNKLRSEWLFLETNLWILFLPGSSSNQWLKEAAQLFYHQCFLSLSSHHFFQYNSSVLHQNYEVKLSCPSRSSLCLTKSIHITHPWFKSLEHSLLIFQLRPDSYFLFPMVDIRKAVCFLFHEIPTLKSLGNPFNLMVYSVKCDCLI